MEGIDQRIGQEPSIPVDLHPDIKRLIYFFRNGGVLPFRRLRNTIHSIPVRAATGIGPVLRQEDMHIFYDYLNSRSGEIKERYKGEDAKEKDLRWNKYILPIALYLSFDRQAVDIDQMKYRRSDTRPPTRFGRFVGEF